MKTSRYGSLALALLLVACASPKEKLEKCQQKCVGLKSDFVQKICNGRCEKEIYGEFDNDKLASLCDEDDPTACLRFAVDAKDPAKVASKLQACCDRKTAECCGLLGKMYSRGKILKEDKPKGYALMEQACSLGDGTACASPGLEQMRKQNYKRAHELFTLGCDKDSKHACGLLGVLYRDGKGTTRDVAQARKFLNKACSLGARMSCKAARRL